jgi:hypothetical protein
MAGADTRCALCSNEIEHYISKALTQRVERTNGILRQQTGRWHRRQNKARQGMGTNESYPTFGHHLLQLELAAFVLGNYCGKREQS